MGDRRPTGLELALLAVVVVALAVGALLGSDESGGDHSSPTTDAEPGGARIAVAPIARRVERLRGLRFQRRLDVTFASPVRAAALYRAATAREQSGFQERVQEEVMKLLGLLEPGVNLDRYLRAVEEEQVLGFYDDRSKRLVVVRGEAGSKAIQEITLAHELTHALEDQHFHISRKQGLSDDRALAETALFEGTATALMIDYARRYFDLSDALDVLNDLGGAETELPKAIEEILLFPYEQGLTFVEAFRARGTWRAVDKVMELRRPRSTEQAIHPVLYAAGEPPVAVSSSRAGRTLGSGWRRVDSGSVGEFDLTLLFEHVGKVRDRGAAAGWGGGRLELWRRNGEGKCPAPCVERDAAVLQVAWDTRRDRAQGEIALRRVVERGLAGSRLAVRRGIGLWSSRGGGIGLRGTGKLSTLVLAPSPALAAKLLRMAP